MTSEIIQGDCREVLRKFPDNYFDSCCCDPPYDLTSGKKGGTGEASLNLDSPAGRSRISTGGFMGKAWDSTGVAFDPATWEEVLRVLKPGGYLLAAGGTRTYHRMTCAIEDAGFEIRDSLHWIYAQGFPKGEACLKPAHEPIVIARKPIEKTVAANVLKYGTGGLNIDGCRVGNDIMRESRTTQSATGNGVYNMHGRDVQHGNWKQKSNENPTEHAGRFPPNILLTHSEDCTPVGTRRVKASANVIRNRSAREDEGNTSAAYGMESRPKGTPSISYGDDEGLETIQTWRCDDSCPVKEMDRQSGVSSSSASFRGERHGEIYGGGLGPSGPDTFRGHDDTGGGSRFFPCFKYQAKAPGRERPKVDGISHATVKPLGLMRWLVRLVTPPEGIVLDPFAGSGTTGEAARLEGFRYVLIEREPDYVKLIHARMKQEPSLFDDWEMVV